MKFRFFLLLTCLLAAAFFRCKPSDEEFSSARDLRIVFSADTLSFDTLLATRPSLSKRLTVRNPNSSAVMLESVRLEKDGGPYELIVNGRKANAVQNLPLFGKDSLLVVVDLTVPEKDQSEPFPVQDRILFELNGSRQQVVLEAWGQQARFFGKTRISKDCTFTAARPYLLSDTLFVEKNAQLTIEAGAKIYCQPNACVWIDGTLDVRGDSDGRVVFRNERSDGRYAYAPGQWKGIVFNNTGENHRMVYADVLNAVDGIQVLQQEPGGLLELNGVIVQNALKNVLYAENTQLRAVNCLFANAGGALVKAESAQLRFEHCTMVNHGLGLIPQEPVFSASDKKFSRSVRITVLHSILDGSKQENLLTDFANSESRFEIKNSLVRTEKTMDGTSLNLNDLQNRVNFQNIRAFDYRLDSMNVSAAKDRSVNSGTAADLLGKARDEKPDLGAYEQFIRKEK
ncbi:MAG: hypothetical protein MI784_02210 [Cytophagales bacterium]|nr:hypothetical protein [Cytophagales bacterium]